MPRTLSRIRARVERWSTETADPTGIARKAPLILVLYEARFRSRQDSQDMDVVNSADVLISASEEFRAAGLSFIELAGCDTEYLAKLLAALEVEAGGPEAFARLLRHPKGWAWRQ